MQLFPGLISCHVQNLYFVSQPTNIPACSEGCLEAGRRSRASYLLPLYYMRVGFLFLDFLSIEVTRKIPRLILMPTLLPFYFCGENAAFLDKGPLLRNIKCMYFGPCSCFRGFVARRGWIVGKKWVRLVIWTKKLTVISRILLKLKTVRHDSKVKKITQHVIVVLVIRCQRRLFTNGKNNNADNEKHVICT